MKIKYPFHSSSVIRVGPIMATKKFQSQFAEIPMALLGFKAVSLGFVFGF